MWVRGCVFTNQAHNTTQYSLSACACAGACWLLLGCFAMMILQTMERCQVVPCWDAVLKQAGGWQERRAAADEFNSKVCRAVV